MNPPALTIVILAAVGILVVSWAVRRGRRAALATSSPRGAPAGGTATTRAQQAGATTAQAEPEVTAGRAPEKKKKPLTADQLAVSRRQFLNRAWTLSFMGFLGFFGMSTLSFLWPKLTGGFGTVINAGDYKTLLSQIGPAAGYKPIFNAEGRFWLTYYDGTGDSPVYLAINAKKYKMQALYRKCVHLGCSVPHCDTSMLFECPCHGSKYRLTGEYFSGPAPRGLDRFPVDVVGGKVMVDTGSVQTGPPRGTDTWAKFSQPVGPLCVPV
jgi:cytochrome b6-f complex iron-sulfur subunit